MRVAATIATLGLALAIGIAARATPSRTPPTVPCSNRHIIYQARSGREGGYRVVLDIVSVPPAHLTQVVRIHRRPWAYWHKAGLVIRASHTPVRISLPKTWRKRAAFTWGYRERVSYLRIAPCPSPPNVWNAYVGGFYLRSRSACVPLIFKVGKRSRTVRFGIGRVCGAAG